MKILAVRGKNLASLAGSFELDLSEPPLGGSGLFVIAGPTGAGKSTILDAMCLALFDRTPRLRGRGTAVYFVHESDREVLSSGDPRCLMRRGAAEAEAEVEFVGRDGRRWRATWSVRRAHRRPDGRIQPQTLKLVDVDTEEQRGGTKTQTLQAIEEALGLDYTAFCRSVLLAQGEFASFLKARAEDRADLLERMTGTSLYGELSMAAHRRAADERAALELIEVQLRSLSRLDPERRAALDADHAALWKQLEAARVDLQERQQARRWHEQLETLRGREADARADLQAACAAWEEAETLRVALEETAAAQAFAGLVADRDRAAQDLQRAEDQRAALRLASEAAAVRATAKREALLALEEERAAAELAATERAPEVERARALDLTLAQTAETAAGVRERHGRLSAEAATAREAAANTSQELVLQTERRDAAGAWLEAHAQDAALAHQWPRWEALLGRLVDLLEARPARLGERSELSTQREAAHAELQAHTADAEAVEARVREANDQTREAEEGAAQAFGGRDLKAAREELDDRRVTLAELRTVLLQARESNKALDHAGREETAAREEIESADGAEREAQAEAERVELTLAEADRAAREARLALGLEDQRHDLRDGEPCPLCGACEHPYASQTPAFSAFVREREQRVGELREELSGLREAAERARVSGAHARSRAVSARARAVSAEEERDKAEEIWLDLSFKLGWKLGQDLPAPWDAKAEETLDWLEEGTRQQLVVVRRLQDDLDRADKALAKAQREQATAQRALAKADKQAAGLNHRWDMLEQALFAEGELERRLCSELAEACPQTGWKEALREDPRGFIAARGEAQRRYREQEEILRQAREATARLEPEAAAAARRADELATAQAEVAEEVARLDARLVTDRSERAALCDGEDATAFQRRLQAAVKGARAREQEARTDVEGAQEERSAAEARLEVAAATERAAEQAMDQARALLTAALEEAGLELSAVRERLERTREWVQERRRTLTDLDRRRTELLQTVEVLANQRQEHESQDACEGDLAAALEAEAAARKGVVAAEASLLDVRARLSADDAVLERAQRLEGNLEGQRARAELWTQLGDLIGSHDGKKFRVFAQSLTLEILLERANATLDTLAPRYRLQRVRGQDLDLEVVDLDMAGEVRAVSSLSGGESFLVSLALALALSSLSSRDTQVDSLFVDEGFGSLDPDAQELALSTLDALQATGRQVALISHVPGLSERVGVGVQVVPQGRGRSAVLVG